MAWSGKSASTVPVSRCPAFASAGVGAAVTSTDPPSAAYVSTQSPSSRVRVHGRRGTDPGGRQGRHLRARCTEPRRLRRLRRGRQGLRCHRPRLPQPAHDTAHAALHSPLAHPAPRRPQRASSARSRPRPRPRPRSLRIGAAARGADERSGVTRRPATTRGAGARRAPRRARTGWPARSAS